MHAKVQILIPETFGNLAGAFGCAPSFLQGKTAVHFLSYTACVPTMFNHLFPFVNSRYNFVRWAAFAWGLLAFWPVGVNHLALLVLLMAVVFQRDVRVRWGRLRNGLMATALLCFGLWAVLTLAVQDTWYSRSPSNLWHMIRIGLTLGLAASLSEDEAQSAFWGFLIGTAGVLVLILGYRAGVYAAHPAWEHLTVPGTNKTIGASILLSMAFGLFMARAAYNKDQWRWLFVVAAITVLALILQTLSKRTAMVGAWIAMVAVFLHLWRERMGRWLLVLLLALGAAWVVWLNSPGLQAAFVQGIREIRDALNGEVKVESWNVRIQMIKHTWDMVLERPWLGWGIGSWNHQWAARVPQEIAEFNMPHNDLLWSGAQGGVLGGLAWLFLMLSGMGVAWRSRGWAGAAALAAILISTFSSLVNNGTRDATIGLPMLWIMGVLISFARADRLHTEVAHHHSVEHTS